MNLLNSLDPESENHVLEKFRIKKEKKNFLYYFSQNETIKLCDEIIMLEDGKVLKIYNFDEFYEKI